MATVSLSRIALQAQRVPASNNRARPAEATQAMPSGTREQEATPSKRYSSDIVGAQSRVAEIMTGRVVTISPDGLLSDAYALMMHHGVRRLPVVHADGTLLGIVTLGDLREARPTRPSSPSIYELNYMIASMRVSSVMTHNPYTARADDPLHVAAQIMLEHRVGGLPVLDAAGKLVGIITESDIFRGLVGTWDLPAVSRPIAG